MLFKRFRRNTCTGRYSKISPPCPRVTWKPHRTIIQEIHVKLKTYNIFMPPWWRCWHTKLWIREPGFKSPLGQVTHNPSSCSSYLSDFSTNGYLGKPRKGNGGNLALCVVNFQVQAHVSVTETNTEATGSFPRFSWWLMMTNIAPLRPSLWHVSNTNK